ncbi:MAG: tetratricopeptide repeat protein [Deltaproteobacteria bacterium]|nr:tetratricopeptide repeat protein [Deltaproteobacteria bacterium]
MQRLGVLATVSLAGLFVSSSVRAQPASDAPPPQAPQTPKQAEADRLFAEGRDLLSKKQPKEACAKFEEANKLDPLAAGTKLNLGLCYEELGKYHTALRWFREAQARAVESNLPDHEKAAKQHQVDLAAKVPSIMIDFAGAAPVNPQVSVDGESIKPGDFAHVEVDPGHHVILVRAPGKKIAREEFDILEKTTKTVTITMVDGESTVVLDPGKPRRYAAYGLVGVGAGAWVFTLIYGITKRNAYDEEKAKMTPEGVTAANQHVKDLKYIGTTVFVVGAVAIGAAATLYFTAPERRTVEETAWAPVIGPDQLGIAVSGSF